MPVTAKPIFRFAVAFMFMGAVSACSVGPDARSIHDPYETANRGTHDFNRSLDQNLLRPVSGVTAALPPELTDRVVSFSDNLSLPGMVVNGLLQGDIGGAATNTMRFLINSTVGVGGLFDPAGGIGLHEESTDFGETLHVWGVPEGAYQELPFFGPSTERDTAGLVVDVLLDPLGWIDQPDIAAVADYSLGAKVVEQVIDRGRFSDTVDSILYDSADSYAQARLLYLENRRYELGMEPPVDPNAEDDCGDLDPMIDPFADPFVAAPADCPASDTMEMAQ
ncbi:VacJ family lipoprotein [Loktanella sp. IMCC34160]|uniref:MlaA family lipoprotein n=1 Tax=Loktanella sp. IMCC34160 TaxID=2510646 RepID=UPI001F5D04BF|nr:VacJ family lipoprotein [Loktanella sp. IMCC34160]